jgi:hypothetical protein
MIRETHFRQCHLCGTLNESEDGKVERCECCGKSLAPFFYFDDRLAAIPGDGTLRPPLMENEYSPILGLTAYWECF